MAADKSLSHNGKPGPATPDRGRAPVSPLGRVSSPTVTSHSTPILPSQAATAREVPQTDETERRKPLSYPEKPLSHPEKRGNWSTRIDFVLSTLGYCVGFGNVWRFPYLLFNHGGGAFLIPYLVMLFAVGLPMFFLELSMGQYSRLGPAHTFAQLCPVFGGLGVAMVVASSLISIYYNVILAWSVYYMAVSLWDVEKWDKCGQSYNTPDCFIVGENAVCERNATIFYNGTCSSMELFCSAHNLSAISNVTSHCLNADENTTTDTTVYHKHPAEEYFLNHVLGSRGASWTNYGLPQWPLSLCLLCVWTLTCLCLMGSVPSLGKLAYFTAISPYIAVTVLIVKGFSMPGAIKGLQFYLIPRFERLLHSGPWVNAASQVFFSLNSSLGILNTIGSYNTFQNNCLRDAIVVSLGNAFLSFYTGFAIFSVLGFLANMQAISVEEVTDEGIFLAFGVYLEGLTYVHRNAIWAFLFFFIMISIGLSSQLFIVENVLTMFYDHYPSMERLRKVYICIGVCTVNFVLGLSLCCPGGYKMFALLDSTAGRWPALYLGLIELIVVMWVYGYSNISRNIESDMTIKLSPVLHYYWKGCWIIIAPVLLMAVFLSYLLPIRYGVPLSVTKHSGDAPLSVDVMGVLISSFPMSIIIVYAVGFTYTKIHRQKQNWSSLFLPTSEWGESAKTLLLVNQASNMATSSNLTAVNTP